MTELYPSPPNTSDATPPARAACTIVSPNDLSYARTLARSYLAHHPDHRFFVLIVANLINPRLFQAEPFEAVLLPFIGWSDLADLSAAAMKYDLIELNANLKPTFLRHLLTAHALDYLLYLDPDIFVYAPLTPVFDALLTHDAVLTPHLTAPVFDGKTPSEQDMLSSGTYNLGFYATRNTYDAIKILYWWERRCLELGFAEPSTGLFVDQKWMNLAPGLFDHIAILRHPGCNMAYWNLNDRTLTGPPDAPVVNRAVPLCFFHFSGIVPSDPASLSKNSDRFTLADRPDLATLFANYKAAINANKGTPNEAIPYGFNVFSDGTAVTLLARRLYAAHEAHFPNSDPFDATGPFYAFCRRNGLLAGPPKTTATNVSTPPGSAAAVNTLLRLALRLLGPNRYELLMRYLAHIAILRNQSTLFYPD